MCGGHTLILAGRTDSAGSRASCRRVRQHLQVRKSCTLLEPGAVLVFWLAAALTLRALRCGRRETLLQPTRLRVCKLPRACKKTHLALGMATGAASKWKVSGAMLSDKQVHFCMQFASIPNRVVLNKQKQGYCRRACVSMLTYAYQPPANRLPHCPTGHQVGVRWRSSLYAS